MERVKEHWPRRKCNAALWDVQLKKRKSLYLCETYAPFSRVAKVRDNARRNEAVRAILNKRSRQRRNLSVGLRFKNVGERLVPLCEVHNQPLTANERDSATARDKKEESSKGLKVKFKSLSKGQIFAGERVCVSVCGGRRWRLQDNRLLLKVARARRNTKWIREKTTTTKKDGLGEEKNKKRQGGLLLQVKGDKLDSHAV